MWFHSHSTCPLCRSLVEPPATTVEEQVTVITISPEQVSATEHVSKLKKRPVFFCWSTVSIAVVKLPGSDDRVGY
ncbi:hypothetical protein YC2023_012361 [Brassica napus]